MNQQQGEGLKSHADMTICALDLVRLVPYNYMSLQTSYNYHCLANIQQLLIPHFLFSG